MYEFFKGSRTKVCYLLHDSVILDFAKEDKNLLIPMLRTFEETRLGYYKANVKMGKDFGNMRDIRVV